MEDSKDISVKTNIWREHWDCGDGCCSDSWLMAQVFITVGDKEYIFETNSECFRYSERIAEWVADNVRKTIKESIQYI